MYNVLIVLFVEGNLKEVEQVDKRINDLLQYAE